MENFILHFLLESSCIQLYRQLRATLYTYDKRYKTFLNITY